MGLKQLETGDLNTQTKISYRQFIRSRIAKLRSIYWQLLLWLICVLFVIAEKYIDIPNLQMDGENYLYAILLIWLTCIAIKLILYYAEYLPFLKQWQDKLERKELNRIKNTYEYQLNKN
ncbi:hypothetical protein [Myroides indicus]|uniref:2TM domain-containing protein n=1 Tax=Myroides indicus TaxID=1323422 RepID=A0A4R7FF24_9FLAO|nr:hypothetical protein [Myroides indicus]TDS66110.1 hypothetical protein C8P70_1013 [Myroides indicus]